MLPKPPLLIFSGLLLMLVSGLASALGLGAMRTQSALNQPFYAEIEVNNVSVDEIDAVKARLASREEFAKAGAERPHFLTRLSFTPAVGTDGRPYVQVSSREPIREPYIDFLVEVIWPQGRLVKEYTVLLDPPARGRSAQPRVVVPRASAPVRRAPPEAKPAPALRGGAQGQVQPRRTAQQASPSLPRPPAAPVPPQARGTRFPLYYDPVPRGATLTRIARELTPPGASVEQTAMAIFRNNQSAFMRGNINLLRAGVDIVVPTAEELFALDQTAARNQFQDALAGRSVNSSPITDVPTDARLRIAASGGAPRPAPGQAAGRRLGQPPAAAGMPGAPVDPRLRDDLLMVQETTESNRQETTELRDRISELESQLSDIQRLLQLRNQELAQLQRSAQGGAAAAGGSLPTSAPPAVPEPLPTSEPALPSQPPVGAPPSETAVTSAGDPADTDRAPAVPVVEPGIGEVQPDSSVEAVITGVSPEAGTGMGTTAEPEAETAAAATAGPDAGAAASDTAEDTGAKPFWADPVDAVTGAVGAAPRSALAAGAGTLIVGGIGLVAYRRRRQKSDLDLDLDFDELPEADDAAVATAAVAESGGEPGKRPGMGPGDFELRSTTPDSLGLGAAQDVDLGVPHDNLHAADDGRRAIDLHTGLPVGVVSNLPANHQDTQEADVIAEADIYILYGRHREAEGLLRDELAKAPGRPDLRYKLGDALLGSGNAAVLAQLLAEMRASGDDQHDAAKWATLENGLAALEPTGGADADQTTEPPPVIRPLDNASTHVGSDGDDALDAKGAESAGLTGATADADLDFWDEAATKMDLARAYVEMADLGAARTILEEVVQEGSDAQRADAQTLLGKIG